MHRHALVGFTFSGCVLLTLIYFATVDDPGDYSVVYRRTRDSLRVPGSCQYHVQCAGLEVCLDRRCESLWTEPFATDIDTCFDACASSLSRRMGSDNILVRAKKLHGYCAVEVEVVNGSAYDGEEKDTLIKLSRRFTETTAAALCRAPPVKLLKSPRACGIDADCETHEVCHASRCVQFWVDIVATDEPTKEYVKINKSLVFTTKNRYAYVRLLAESPWSPA